LIKLLRWKRPFSEVDKKKRKSKKPQLVDAATLAFPPFRSSDVILRTQKNV
jgi:hypothetical protein